MRATRLVIEVLGRGATDALRATRLGIEVLGRGAVDATRVSRVSLEVLGALPDSWLQTSRVSLEVLGAQLDLWVSRIGLEVLGSKREVLTMFIFEAPYPAIQTTSLLPNPQFSDQEGSLATVTRKLAIDGTRYTYVKRRNRRKLKWTFQVTRNKGLEVRAFFQSYFASKVRVTDHNGRVWLGHFTSNPFEFDTTAAARPAIAPLPRGETQMIEVEFEGVEQ